MILYISHFPLSLPWKSCYILFISTFQVVDNFISIKYVLLIFLGSLVNDKFSNLKLNVLIITGYIKSNKKLDLPHVTNKMGIGVLFILEKMSGGLNTSLTFTWVKSCQRPEVKSEPTWHSWIMTFMNNGKAFPSLDGMIYSYPCHDQLQFLSGHW